MKLSKSERNLLRHLAEAYAFLLDLRESAILTGKTSLTQRTDGVEEKVEYFRGEYPHVFQRYLTDASKRARKSVTKKVKEIEVLVSDKGEDNGEKNTASPASPANTFKRKKE